MEPDDNQLTYHLNLAQEHAQMALDLLYSPSQYKRGIFYRLRLGRAQNSLMTLLVRELGKGDYGVKSTDNQANPDRSP